MLQRHITDNALPGAVALIARNGKIIFHKGYGLAYNSSNTNLGCKLI